MKKFDLENLSKPYQIGFFRHFQGWGRTKGKLVIIIALLAFVIVLITSSYALFRYSRTGKNINTIKMGNIEFSMLDGDSITISNVFPESDSDGNLNDPYTFTVKNKSSDGLTLYYNVSFLTNNNDSSINYFKNEHIKYSLVKNGAYVADTSSTTGNKLSTIDGFNEGVSIGDGIVLDSQAIDSQTTDTYELRIWISDDVSYNSEIDENGLSTGLYNDCQYSLKVRVNAKDETTSDSSATTSLYTGSELKNIFVTLAGGSASNITAIKSASSIPMATAMNESGIARMALTEIETTPISADESARAWFESETGTIYIYSYKETFMNENSSEMFYNFSNLTDISALTNWNTLNVTNMDKMFYGCSNLTDISALTNWNTLNVTHMSYMFRGCSSLMDIGALAKWNTSNVTDMSYMFYDCSSLTDISALTNWNTSNVTTMYDIFYRCSNLTDISALARWNISNVKFTYGMFYECSSLTDISALTNWEPSKVTNMQGMFRGCSNLTDLSPLENWKPSIETRVVNIRMENIFYKIPSTVTRPSWYK